MECLASEKVCNLEEHYRASLLIDEMIILMGKKKNVLLPTHT